MHALKRLADMVSTAEGVKNYMTWFEDPITQAMLAAIRELGRPRRPGMGGVETAHLLLGETLGYNGAADFMENPGSSTSKVGGDIVASYGAGPKPEQ